MNAINAFFGPAFQNLEPMLYSDPYEKMLMIAATEPEESRDTCTRWWIEDLIAAQVRAEEGVCGEDAQVIEPYVAWLSDEQLREIDELESCSQTKAHSCARARPRGDVRDAESQRNTASASTSTSISSSSSSSSSTSASASQTGTSQTREKGRAGGVDPWMFQAERAMDVWSEVLGVIIDRTNGISPEERAQRCEPYAEWAGPPPPFTDYGSVFC
ncbi:hypothetical protein ONZ51_g440 [Trametes cubensis]|uniref:Uncharacterized protein n=1 Tax=Trametes cubensis TaxID=1111947 RepID=A0AAD7XGE8_9APHY|nr:hypothetical protein ONZ51_g440 [Trametes cubensis]